MMIDNFKSGWISEPARVQEVIAQRHAMGQAVMASTFGATQQPTLPGTWARMKAQGCKGVFLRDLEPLVYGSYLRPYFQKYGTCVARGMARGIQTSLTQAIFRLKLIKPVKIAFAPIYSMARHEFGHDRCGRGDGAILADAANAVHNGGVATDDLFIGKTEDEIERLAVQFAAPGVGTPAAWLAAAKGHPCITFWPDTLDLLFDCLAAGYAVPYAHGYVTGMPNKNGISDLGDPGSHCRCFTGVFVDLNGDTQLESSESWGRYAAGQPHSEDSTMPVDQIPCTMLRYANGIEKKLAPGNVGVIAKRWWDQMRNNGEGWAVSHADYFVKSVTDAIRSRIIT